MQKIPNHEHTVESLAEALYEGLPTVQNLAENMARQHGRAGALSFFGLMAPEVQFFWLDIASQIIEHSKEWKRNDPSGCCILSKKETDRLRIMWTTWKMIEEKRSENV